MTEEAKRLKDKTVFSTEDLMAILRLLRSPDGCPWDRVQTHKTIRNDFLEEAYEAIEAIDRDDPAMMEEELGDVLLQVCFHASLAQDEGRFTMEQVVTGICTKLIVRHPHVFGEVSVEGVGDVLTNWDRIKQETKEQETVADVLSGVSRALPSLTRAKKLAKRCEKAGLPVPKPPVDFEAMLGELSSDQRKQAVGEWLFALTAAARHCDIEAEEALYDTCESLITAAQTGENIHTLS